MVLNKGIYFFVCLLFVTVIRAQGAWFGPKKEYKCNCETSCNSDGTCTSNGKCLSGWFGLKCQYQDLVLQIGTTVSPSNAKLTDRDDTTCFDADGDVVIDFNRNLVFTWMRIVVKDETLLSTLTVQFKKGRDQPIIDCYQKRFYLVGTLTLDIRCYLQEEIQQVIVTGTGVKSICSLYINGGRNVALKQETNQTSSYNDSTRFYDSSLAVDGNTNADFYKNSCTHTQVNDIAPMWRVHFIPSQITRYVLYNRNSDQGRLIGFTLEANSSTNDLFTYQDTSTSNTPVYTVLDVTNRIIQDVRIKSKSGQILTLCEVEIYGECPAGTYDLDCTKCKASCKDTCHIDDGSCNVVCLGYINPPDCDTDCTGNRWGLNCTRICSPYCQSPPCNKINGNCPGGCSAGYQPPDCVKGCTDGYWGKNCTNICSRYCHESKTCDKFNGQCPSGCIAGYEPPLCDKDCNNGTWGINCNETCSRNCKDPNQCDKFYGHCLGGCAAGFQLPDCVKNCFDNSWGVNCSQTCSNHCKSKPCNTVTGQCPDGCQPGYSTPNCNTSCVDGRWGENCTNNCSRYCHESKTCDKINGQCPSGCIAGYKPPNCDEECGVGYWGVNCSLVCNFQCLNNSCHHKDGYCLHGCIDGYQSHYCTQECDETKYGFNCSMDCSTTCTNQTCHHVNGTCYRCDPGYLGNFCNQFCPDTTFGQDCQLKCNTSCLNQLCHPPNGVCKNCADGRHGDQCDICPSGKYGKGCSEDCSLYCNSSLGHTCRPEDGVCKDGCVDGYSDTLCIAKCEGKTFGPMCTGRCSDRCRSNSSFTCHHVNGACLLGCNDDYSGTFCQDESKVGAIVGSVIAVIIVALLVVGGVILWKRKHRKKPRKQSDDERLQHLNEFTSPVTNETDVDSAYCNIPVVAENTKIAVDSLSGYLKSHKVETLAEHYRKIPKPKNVSTEVGQSDENKHKNRYKNICPYDHSRVHLMINTGKQEGDYINASYIRDNRNDVKFIAAQGPYNTVLNDFVRMLWEQKTDKVVMLTNLIEEGKAKCEKYWPDSDKTMFGEIKMKLKETHQFADYVIRIIEMGKKGEISRILKHYHFTSWPDQGVPLTPWALVDFEQKVDASKATTPIVVHCSAGVGRTGTFIALHNIMRQAEETGYVDFFNTLTKLREDRVLMIQTADQYIFLHKAAQAAITCIGSTVTSSDIRTRIKHLEENAFRGVSNMEKEFNSICATIMDGETQTENADNIYQNAESVKTETNSDEKNRFPSITPRNSYRPYLNHESEEMGSYINAVFIPGFQKKDQHLLTQLPMPTTFIDFWRLVTQYKVSLVVAFEVDSMMTDKTIANYLPSGNQPIISSPIEIHSESIKEDSLWEAQTLKVSIKSGHHTLIHLKCKDTELNARKLLNFVNKSRSYNAQADGRILYTCRDGATFSGLACVLSLLLDRMDHDSCLTVPLVVGSIKSIRPEVIPTFEQYQMLYEALDRYNETTATYSNVDESIFLKSSKAVNGLNTQSHGDDGNVYHNM